MVEHTPDFSWSPQCQKIPFFVIAPHFEEKQIAHSNILYAQGSFASASSATTEDAQKPRLGAGTHSALGKAAGQGYEAIFKPSPPPLQNNRKIPARGYVTPSTAQSMTTGTSFV